MNTELNRIKQWAETISGNWNGDDSGIEEERSDVANDIIIAIDNLQELIDELNELL